MPKRFGASGIFLGDGGTKQSGKFVPVENLDEATQAAVDLWNDQRDDLQAGRKPRKRADDTVTLRNLVNRYVTAKKRLLTNDELSPRTFSEYHRACDRVISAFGSDRPVADLTTSDVEKLRADLAEIRGPVTLANEIQRIRMIFKWGYDAGELKQPIRYGQSFNGSSSSSARCGW